LVVILAIVAVFIAKETVQRGQQAAPTQNQGVAQNPTAQVAPGGSPLGSGESKGTPASTPSLAGTPGSIGGASPGAKATAGQPTSEKQDTASSANPQSAQPKATPGKKPEGPLPGSKLADCLKSGRPTMADFGRGWCKPCKAMVPVLKQAAQDYWGKANIVFVELGEYMDLARKYRIAVMPEQIFFDAKGKEVSRHMGYIDNEGIDAQFAQMGLKK
jgi:thioredoxin 1